MSNKLAPMRYKATYKNMVFFGRTQEEADAKRDQLAVKVTRINRSAPINFAPEMSDDQD